MSKVQRLVLDCSGDKVLTKQADKDACDINKILKRYAKTGVIQHMNRYSPRYGDFTNIPDFATVQNLMIEASTAFDALPAKLRKEFDNDPAKLIDFCSDPKNADKAVELGLIEKPKQEPKVESKAPIAPIEGAKEGVKA